MRIIHRGVLGGNDIQPGNRDIRGKQIVERRVLHRNGLVIHNQPANAPENEHTGQGCDEGGDSDKADPVPLPRADRETNQQAERDHQIRIPVHVGDQNRGQTANQTDDRSDGKVNVTACQNTKQHAAGHDQHVTVLKQQV